MKDNVFSFSSIIDYSFYTMHNSIPTYVSDVLNQPFPTFKIWLNLVAKLKRKDSDIYPNAQDIIYKTKYLMNTNEISDASMGTANLFLNYPDNLTLHDQSINSDIFAWGDITIGDNVTVATGGPYKVISGGKIIISNSNSAKLLTPNLILQTGVGNLCNTPMYKPVSDVSSFCNDNGNSDYKPNNRAQTLILKDEETDNSNTAKTGLEIKTELYDCKPNPANSSTSILYYAPKGSVINFDISNIFGEIVIRLENTTESFTGEHSKVIDTSKFPSGTYFVTMRSAEKTETKKLIIIK
ncbi:MAG: T9SS type A sorting domain-containing protein [Candidatus Kapabacteria bacterium]|nr:T9SS type A sorting domain-containing protein [Candidatus Kapabacteria bacterium]